VFSSTQINLVNQYLVNQYLSSNIKTFL